MNKMHAFFKRLRHSPIVRIGAAMLVALVLTGHVSCAGTTETGNVLREIHDAARDGDFGKVQTLVKGNPGLVFNKDEGGFTPLHWAASSGHKDVAELLLAHGADVNAKNNNGSTPLHFAAALGHKDVAELLLAHGADVNAKNKGGSTPLHFAAALGHKDVAELLLAHGADVNAKNNNGWTPLYYAVSGGHKDVAQLLRQHGGD